MGMRIADFDFFRENYAGAQVTVKIAGTSTNASLFTDEACTVPTGNPQTLTTFQDGDDLFGKFQQPVYTNAPGFYLVVDTGEQSGVIRQPIFTLDNADADDALVIPTGRSLARSLDDHLAQQVWAEDFGAFTASASGNNTILQAAIGAAAALGGGEVLLPAGTITFTQLTLPAGVVLTGKGMDVTILQSVVADKIITTGGDASGLQDLTLDGLSKQAGSTAVYGESRQRIRLDRVKVKRFDRGLRYFGLSHCRWNELFVTDNAVGVGLIGDTSSNGGKIQFVKWIGGELSVHSNTGLIFEFVDSEISFNQLSKVKISGNVTAITQDAARFCEYDDCSWDTNTTNLAVRDDFAGSPNPLAKTQGLQVRDCDINGGTIAISGTAQDIGFSDCAFRGVTFALTTPRHAIKLINCTEDATTTITGDGTKLVREFANLGGFTRGVTTGNAATKAWSLKLDHGEMCTGIAKVTGKQRNGINKAFYCFAFGAQKAPPTLAYDAQTANFTVGQTLTGGTSGATGRIIADADGGLTGTLTLHSITGTFVDNEIITDGVGGSATANGALVAGSVAILAQASITNNETDATWACVAAATVDECEVHVTGATGQTVDWTVHVEAQRFG